MAPHPRPAQGAALTLADNPVARTPKDVRATAQSCLEAGSLPKLDAVVSECRACPRLVAWRELVATEKRRAYADEDYWGRPIPGWGDEQAAVLVVGLAPAAHGGNRTGRVFTGDRSGDWLFAALHRAGLAAIPTSTHAGDGQRLLHTRMLAAVRCAPPANAPTPQERETCAPWMDAEIELLLPHLKVVIALGAFAWTATLASLSRLGLPVPRPRPRFTHAATAEIGPLLLVGSFHPSQQNTFTGKLTEPMLDQVMGLAVDRAGLRPTL